MFIKKIIISLVFMCFLNGCAQTTAFLGPFLTGASTGSLSQAGLSYASSKAVKEITGKTSTENLKNIFSKNTTEKEVD